MKTVYLHILKFVDQSVPQPWNSDITYALKQDTLAEILVPIEMTWSPVSEHTGIRQLWVSKAWSKRSIQFELLAWMSVTISSTNNWLSLVVELFHLRIPSIKDDWEFTDCVWLQNLYIRAFKITQKRTDHLKREMGFKIARKKCSKGKSTIVLYP